MTTITLPRAVVEQALEAMRRAVPTGQITLYEWDKAMDDLRAALAQQGEPQAGCETEADCTSQPWCRIRGECQRKQAEPVEPVAEARYDGTLRWLEPHGVGLHRIQGPLYTAPPQRKPLPKHDQHCVDVPGYGLMPVRLVRAVERAHGIKE